ncbi:ankyrin repeat domain-containing protein [Wolbachia endosymbiont (group A) of Volucella inflata]|uniref:ankyrin repeat domain-containing protein n=1 Tax=Wolbachia endosymbiont (group A) of Volucella inflata TaxID=2954065 RepID=UPI002226EE2B|nr:ankyrin repeat domain-containing protein [Wolbachia endosymbiont (group A) of Volucella inflata]
MQGLGQILIAVNCSQNLNKDNIADKIKAEIEAKSNERNLGTIEKFLKLWEKNNFDLKKFPCGDLLQFAAKFNCAKLAEHLVANSFDINDGFPLHCAAQHGHTQVAEILLAEKADVSMQDRKGFNPLDYAVHLGNKIEMVRLLLRAGATNVQNGCGFTPLHHTAECGYVQMVEILLKEGRTDVNARDKKGRTPLHYAAGHGHTQVVEVLLEEGADVNAQDEDKGTPLHYAAYSGHIEVVKHLIKKEADVNVVDKYGRSPLHYAAENGYTQVVEVLLEEGADVNAQDEDKETPLHIAAEHGHIKIVKLLLKNGANVNLQNKNRYTPLSCAWHSKYPEIAKLLLNYSADPSCIHRPKAMTAGITEGVISAVVVSLVLAYATALPALAIIGITAASALIVGGMSYGVAYKSSEHSLNSKLSEVSCSNVYGNKQTVQP